jgi:hypothetical protein
MAALILLFSGCRSKNNDAAMSEEKSNKVTNLTASYELEKVFFVGMIGQKPGLYKYDFASKTFSEFWKNDKEEVVEFSYSPNKRSAFIITASQLGKKGVFPFINDVKLYTIDLESSKVILTENIGSGIQVYSAWINDSSFHVYFHTLDVTGSKYVEQSIKVYHSSGKKLSAVNKNFYLDKQGFPSFPSDEKQWVSPNEKYSLLSLDSALTQILISDKNKDGKTTVLTKVNQKLHNVCWSNDGNFLIFSTKDITPNNETIYDPEPNTSKLFIFSISEYKMQKVFEGGGIKNFMLNGNYLLFDDGFKEKSRVYIYNINTNAISDSIIIRGGCGLKNIPLIPDYES